MMQRDQIASVIADRPGITVPRLCLSFKTSLPSMTGQVHKLEGLGRVVRLQQRGQLIRWFASADALAAWMLTPESLRMDEPRANGKARDLAGPQATALDRTPAVSVHASPTALAYDGRYQCAPGEQVRGGGFAAAGVGFDALVGRPWGA